MYGQASCTAGRASFMTGRIPIRRALSVVVGPGDRNQLTKDVPTIAEFFQNRRGRQKHNDQYGHAFDTKVPNLIRVAG